MGVMAHHTWIGSRDIPYTYHDVPTTSSDNHMIAAYIDSTNNIIFLDATSKLLPFGMPSSFIQGKQALIKNTIKKPIQTETVPINDASKKSYTDTTFLYLKGKGMHGNSRIVLQGYTQQHINRQLQQANDKDTKNFLKRYTRKGNNTYNVLSYTITNKNEREQPLILETDFAIQNLVIESNNEIFINLNIDLIADRYEIRQDREYPIENDYAESFTITNILTIPENYKIHHIPQNSSYTSDLFNYEITYRVESNKIFYTFHMSNRAIFVDKKDFTTLREFTAHMKSAYKESIILTKN